MKQYSFQLDLVNDATEEPVVEEVKPFEVPNPSSVFHTNMQNLFSDGMLRLLDLKQIDIYWKQDDFEERLELA